MGDPILVVTDSADDVAFHDLHVIDVVQQLDAWRAHGFDHGDPEGSPVALVVGVIHLAVQELEADGDAPRFRLRDRKSTRLNSSHLVISYAVFCLKKKTRTQ